MSVDKTPALNNGDEVVKSSVTDTDKSNATDTNRKRRRFNQCFSFKELQVEPVSSLKDLDSTKFKAEIKRWAKAVVAYARQVSGKFGSTKRSDGRHGSSRSCHHRQ
ncbi:FBD-associated F-box protein [Hibiscus syriacus]|uniref:FBD-associated F-box protein n=1 Tax=Hibiscus syriacus TaxID=106335 RepID=A0A6A2ZWM5_HIBSY|nr:FBD-associated F-box protein [Hibiscus syriacus]